MTTKPHTETPWIVGKTHIYGPSNGVMQAKQSGPYKTLAVCDIDDDPTNEANAAYIVKAVNCHEDLVDALHSLMETWLCNPDHYADEIERYAVILSKAKGKAA